MPRTTVEITLEVDVEYDILPPEPDVGFMFEDVGDLVFINPDTGESIPNFISLLSDKQIENIREELIDSFHNTYEEE